MKKKIILLLCTLCCLSLYAQEKLYIHKSDNITLGALISSIDSIYFDNSNICFSVGNRIRQFPIIDIDSISFGSNSSTISIMYKDSSVSIINPLAFEGISVAADGADVTVTSTSETKDITYKLSGSTINGMFKIYSQKRFSLLLDNINITNPIGPAINIQSDNKATITLVDGTTNTLTDGSAYAAAVKDSSGADEDQKATFFSEGKLVLNGGGKLIINGNGAKKHALCSDDLIEIDGGNINITSAPKDGIHTNDGVIITNGTLNITATGDAIDGDAGCIDISGGSVTTLNSEADVKSLTCDSTIVISGGNVDITINGNQSKGIKSGHRMTLSGGNIKITTSGNAVLESSGSGYDPSYCSGIKCDSAITISGAVITIKTTGKGGKGISSDSDINIISGSVDINTSGAGVTYKNASGVTDAYNSTCISANGNVNILGGTVINTTSGTAAKAIKSDLGITIGDEINSPTLNIATSGAKVYLSGSGDNSEYAEAKAISSDGAITINNGKITISSADDGIKSDVSVTINNGEVLITKSIEGIEAPYITVNKGNVSIAASDDSFNSTKGNGGEANDGSCLTFNGGNIGVNSTTGDGLDSNGSIVITGGTIVVHGPQSQPEVGMDYNGTCNISGGLLVVSGIYDNRMTQATSTTSAQYCVKASTSKSITASTIFHIQDASGNDIVTFKPVRAYSSIIFSSSGLQSGATYSIYTGGSSTGTEANGLYSGGIYSGGTLKKTFTISGKVTSVSF